jgi:hypothetical protein
MALRRLVRGIANPTNCLTCQRCHYLAVGDHSPTSYGTLPLRILNASIEAVRGVDPDGLQCLRQRLH